MLVFRGVHLDAFGTISSQLPCQLTPSIPSHIESPETRWFKLRHLEPYATKKLVGMIDFPKMEIQQQYCQTTETTTICGFFGSITNRVGFFLLVLPVSPFHPVSGQRVSPDGLAMEAVQEVQMESQSWYAKASAVVEAKGGWMGPSGREDSTPAGMMVVFHGWGVWCFFETKTYEKTSWSLATPTRNSGESHLYNPKNIFSHAFLPSFVTQQCTGLLCAPKLLWNSMDHLIFLSSSFYWSLSHFLTTLLKIFRNFLKSP